MKHDFFLRMERATGFFGEWVKFKFTLAGALWVLQRCFQVFHGVGSERPISILRESIQVRRQGL